MQHAKKASMPVQLHFARAFSRTPVRQNKVCVVGAAGGIGQPLSLLLKNSPLVKNLSLFDLAPTKGIACDLSHICSPAKVVGYSGAEALSEALKDATVVVIPAGVPRKPGMSRDDLFNVNAGIVKNIATVAASSCPKAMFCVISNPVNSMVPLFAEILKQHKVYDPKRLFGVTTLDVVRAQTFVAENQKMNVLDLKVTVIGGHAGTTILPVLGQVPGAKFSEDDLAKLTKRIMFGGDEVVEAKAGAGSATLSMAYAGADFATKLLRAMNGEHIVECTYVEQNIYPTSFFATPVVLGPHGVKEVLKVDLNAYETKLFNDMIGDLRAQIEKGVKFAHN